LRNSNDKTGVSFYVNYFFINIIIITHKKKRYNKVFKSNKHKRR